MTLRIMLVDDNLTFLASVKKVLATLAQTQVVAEAHNGAQALEMAARLQPDLMLLDIVMPGMTGLEVAQTMQTWARSPSAGWTMLWLATSPPHCRCAWK